MSELALHGGTPVRRAPMHPSWPMFGEMDGQRLLDVLTSRAWGGFPEPSPRARAFADAFARHHDADFGILCSNGSVSLEMAELYAGALHEYLKVRTGTACLKLRT